MERLEARRLRRIGPAILNTRTALLLGFGGLLALLIFTGLDAIRVLSQARSANAAIRREFLERARRLDEIRSALYLSGTLVRDYLLEPDPGDADRQREALRAVRARMDSELADYAKLVPQDETAPVSVLRRELDSYWRSLDPVLGWNAEQRRRGGYAFLRDEVFPRRTAMLGIADQIAGVNAGELTSGDRRLAEMFVAFRSRLLGTLAITLGLGLLLAGASMGRILRLERETDRHLEAVTQARAQLRELSARLVEAQEHERKSISRELHDAVGQSLSAVLFELRNLVAEIPPDSTSLRAHADTIRKLVEGSVAMVRNMALLLRPSMLDDLGLVPALEWHAREVSKNTGLIVNVAAAGIPEDLPEEHKTCIYRIVQESLHNVVRHAHARTARVTIQMAERGIELTIQDDGEGFTPALQKGLGLIGIQERVENLAGKLHVRSAAGQGTMLSVYLPLLAATA
jgi:signal transduction histidine kinase